MKYVIHNMERQMPAEYVQNDMQEKIAINHVVSQKVTVIELILMW
jgi:hypothetical protein